MKQVLGICLVEVTRWKCGDDRVCCCWWTVVVGWSFLVVPVWKSVGVGLTGTAEAGM